MLQAQCTWQICHGRLEETSEWPHYLLAAPCERPGNAVTCLKNINSVGSRLRASLPVDVFETGTRRLTGRAQFCPPYQITLSPRANIKQAMQSILHIATTIRSVCSTLIFILTVITFSSNTWQMANGWQWNWLAAFLQSKTCLNLQILVPYLDCVRSLLAAGRRMYMSAQCATGISLHFYQSGNQWNKTTSTWKCCATLVLSEVRKWSANLHFGVLFVIEELRQWQLSSVEWEMVILNCLPQI
jgi:hypothetical protein